MGQVPELKLMMMMMMMKPHDVVVKFDTYRNFNPHRTVLPD